MEGEMKNALQIPEECAVTSLAKRKQKVLLINIQQNWTSNWLSTLHRFLEIDASIELFFHPVGWDFRNKKQVEFCC